uniref:ribosomal protein S11 n=1 Tax=Hypnea marchantiae TaxID=3024792 RepID=UPI0030010AC5|nr:ribosomal protein S11 [Hypnea marchantiae]
MDKKIIILHILFTTNNILYTITDLKGNTLFWASVGSNKIKNTKKITTTSIFLSIKRIKFFLNKSNVKYLFLKLKGFNKQKKIVLKYLKQFYSQIILVCEKTNLPHNGCKNRKIRRL